MQGCVHPWPLGGGGGADRSGSAGNRVSDQVGGLEESRSLSAGGTSGCPCRLSCPLTPVEPILTPVALAERAFPSSPFPGGRRGVI